MRKAIKYILIGFGSLLGLVILVIAFIVILPESPSSKESRGPFEIYWYHYASLGEPGRSRSELWYRGKQLAEYPTFTSINPEMDRIIFVNARDSGFDSPAPKGNGIYYFDTGNKKRYLLAAGKYPSFFNGVEGWPGSGTRINATPWSPDGSFAVVSYGDSTSLPKAAEKNGRIIIPFEKESVLLVDLATGKVRNAAELLGVSESQHIVFERWSDDKSVLFFSVDDEARTLDVSVVTKKDHP
jgi:hypothetical protein